MNISPFYEWMMGITLVPNISNTHEGSIRQRRIIISDRSLWIGAKILAYSASDRECLRAAPSKDGIRHRFYPRFYTHFST